MGIKGNQFWASEADTIRKMYWEDRKTLAEIAEHYDVYPKTLTEQMRKNGIPTRHSAATPYNSKYEFNRNFFDVIDTEEKAWVLGFIISDGHVSKQGSIMFSVHERDEDILDKINSVLESNVKVQQKRGTPYCSLTLTSRYMCSVLLEYGLNSNKSKGFDFAKVLEVVPDELKVHLIRGMFDGDGSLRVYKYDYFKKHSYHFGYTGTYETCSYVRNFFELFTKMVDEGGAWTCVTSNHADILRICDILYSNATIYGNRKYHTYLEILGICSVEFAAS